MKTQQGAGPAPLCPCVCFEKQTQMKMIICKKKKEAGKGKKMNQLLLCDPTAASHVPPWFWLWFLWPGRALGHTQLIPFLSPSCICYLLAFNSPAGKKNSETKPTLSCLFFWYCYTAPQPVWGHGRFSSQPCPSQTGKTLPLLLPLPPNVSACSLKTRTLLNRGPVHEPKPLGTVVCAGCYCQ